MNIVWLVEVVPDLLATEYITDLGDETWQLPSELRPRHRRPGIGQELFTDQVVQRGDAMPRVETGSRLAPQSRLVIHRSAAVSSRSPGPAAFTRPIMKAHGLLLAARDALGGATFADLPLRLAERHRAVLYDPLAVASYLLRHPTAAEGIGKPCFIARRAIVAHANASEAASWCLSDIPN